MQVVAVIKMEKKVFMAVLRIKGKKNVFTIRWLRICVQKFSESFSLLSSTARMINVTVSLSPRARSSGHPLLCTFSTSFPFARFSQRVPSAKGGGRIARKALYFLHSIHSRLVHEKSQLNTEQSSRLQEKSVLWSLKAKQQGPWAAAKSTQSRNLRKAIDLPYLRPLQRPKRTKRKFVQYFFASKLLLSVVAAVKLAEETKKEKKSKRVRENESLPVLCGGKNVKSWGRSTLALSSEFSFCKMVKAKPEPVIMCACAAAKLDGESKAT